MTEVWFRNPHDYIKEMVEVGVGNVAWDRGMLIKRKIDPLKHASVYFGRTVQYRILLVGEQGTAEYGPDSVLEAPMAVYPTWSYGEELSLLEEILESPPGHDLVACNDTSVPKDLRPVWGQESRVVITDIPKITTGPGRKFLTVLRTLQEDYPETIVHLHGLYGFRAAFGMGFGAADIEVRTSAQKGKVLLPSGKEVRYEATVANPEWTRLLGYNPVDLKVPRNRCMFNIKSALWAGENYERIFNFRTRPVSGEVVDFISSDADHKPAENHRALMRNKLDIKPGDKFECNSCSLALSCKHYRDGAVCSLPGEESPTDLAKLFKTRDSNLIIEGLGTLVAANTKRLERGMQEEAAFGDVDPNVTKLLGAVFDQGIKLAKLVDPNLRGGAKVQVNVGAGGAAAISMANPKQLVAQAIRSLEEQGIARENITEDMIRGLLEGMANPEATQNAITSTVVSRRDEAS